MWLYTGQEGSRVGHPGRPPNPPVVQSSHPVESSERERRYMSSSVRLSVCRSSITFVHPTQAIDIFGNVSTPFGTLAICDLSIKILRRSSQGNPSGEGLNQRGAAKSSDFGPFQCYISETVQDKS